MRGHLNEYRRMRDMQTELDELTARSQALGSVIVGRDVLGDVGDERLLVADVPVEVLAGLEVNAALRLDIREDRHPLRPDQPL